MAATPFTAAGLLKSPLDYKPAELQKTILHSRPYWPSTTTYSVYDPEASYSLKEDAIAHVTNG